MPALVISGLAGAQGCALGCLIALAGNLFSGLHHQGLSTVPSECPGMALASMKAKDQRECRAEGMRTFPLCFCVCVCMCSCVSAGAHVCVCVWRSVDILGHHPLLKRSLSVASSVPSRLSCLASEPRQSQADCLCSSRVGITGVLRLFPCARMPVCIYTYALCVAARSQLQASFPGAGHLLLC